MIARTFTPNVKPAARHKSTAWQKSPARSMSTRVQKSPRKSRVTITDSFGRLRYRCREEIELRGDKIQMGLFNLLDLAETGK